MYYVSRFTFQKLNAINNQFGLLLLKIIKKIFKQNKFHFKTLIVCAISGDLYKLEHANDKEIIRNNGNEQFSSVYEHI